MLAVGVVPSNCKHRSWETTKPKHETEKSHSCEHNASHITATSSLAALPGTRAPAAAKHTSLSSHSLLQFTPFKAHTASQHCSVRWYTPATTLLTASHCEVLDLQTKSSIAK